MHFLKKITNSFISRLAQKLKFYTRDWECTKSILLARNLMGLPGWIEWHDLETKLSSKEFRVYSQFGDDGIIQFLIKLLNIEDKSFIEFGVADFYESNTHFLLVNNNWNGFVIDGSGKNIEILKESSIYWRYSINAEVAFVTADNINYLLGKSGFKNPGILHIDLDGNDYWVLKSIDFNKFRPAIMILEYNSLFGSERSISVPYDPAFERLKAHFSGQYFGASIAALNSLASSRGYYFIGCNSAGNNAYFLDEKFRSIIKPVKIEDGFVVAKFRDLRNVNGELIFGSREECQNVIKGLPVYNVEAKSIEFF